MQIRKHLRAPFIALSIGCVLGLLAGCGPDQPPSITLEGQLTYAGDTKVPQDSNARISMVERGENGADKRIVAERSLHNIGQKPIGFDISVDRSLISGEGTYGLRAEIVDGSGEVRWATPKPHDIEPMDGAKPVTLKLEATAPPEQLTFEKYRCEDGFHLGAATADAQAVVRLGNRRLVLKAADEQGAKRFSDDHGNELRIADDGVSLKIDGAEHRNCAIVTNQTPQGEGGTAQAATAGSQSDNPDNKQPQGDSSSQPDRQPSDATEEKNGGKPANRNNKAGAS